MLLKTILTAIIYYSACTNSATTDAKISNELDSSGRTTLSLSRLVGTKNPSSLHLQRNRPLISSSALEDVDLGQVLLTGVSFGGQALQAVVDTGSSDTWFINAGFVCLNATDGTDLTEEDCMFGPTVSQTTAFSPIPDEHLNVTYSDGEMLYGLTGYASVNVGSITVPQQQVSLVSLAAWFGDGISSGLLGLSYPALTSVFSGINGSMDNFTTNHVVYSPILTTMIANGLIAPGFSLAISRDFSQSGSGGVLEIGGVVSIMDPAVNASDMFASAPIQKISDIGDTGATFEFYAIDVDGVVTVDGVLFNSSGLFIVDSGTTLNYVPTDAATAINALFDPPATFDPDYGVYVVNCDAVPPEHGYIIGGELFAIKPSDLVTETDGLPANLCVSGVQDGGDGSEGPFILGDTFLRNTLAVFDVGAEVMSFSSRMYYES